MEKKYWKSQGKVREFCQPGKVGTLFFSPIYLPTYLLETSEYGTEKDVYLSYINAIRTNCFAIFNIHRN